MRSTLCKIGNYCIIAIILTLYLSSQFVEAKSHMNVEKTTVHVKGSAKGSLQTPLPLVCDHEKVEDHYEHFCKNVNETQKRYINWKNCSNYLECTAGSSELVEVLERNCPEEQIFDVETQECQNFTALGNCTRQICDLNLNVEELQGEDQPSEPNPVNSNKDNIGLDNPGTDNGSKNVNPNTGTQQPPKKNDKLQEEKHDHNSSAGSGLEQMRFGFLILTLLARISFDAFSIA